MPAKIYISYAPGEDDQFLVALETHLALLQRQGTIQAWHERKIVAGDEQQAVIDANFEAADVILLLVSPSFIASDYCYGTEMPRALERHSLSETCVIPIILRPVDNWASAPFGRLQCLPQDGKAISTWSHADEAWTQVVAGLRATINGRRQAAADSSHLQLESPVPTVPRILPLTWLLFVEPLKLHAMLARWGIVAKDAPLRTLHARWQSEDNILRTLCWRLGAIVAVATPFLTIIAVALLHTLRVPIIWDGILQGIVFAVALGITLASLFGFGWGLPEFIARGIPYLVFGCASGAIAGGLVGRVALSVEFGIGVGAVGGAGRALAIRLLTGTPIGRLLGIAESLAVGLVVLAVVVFMDVNREPVHGALIGSVTAAAFVVFVFRMPGYLMKQIYLLLGLLFGHMLSGAGFVRLPTSIMKRAERYGDQLQTRHSSRYSREEVIQMVLEKHLPPLDRPKDGGAKS